MDDMAKTCRLRIGAWMYVLSSTFICISAQIVPTSSWALESMSPGSIVLAGNTAEALDGYGFGSKQPAHARWHAVYWEREALSLVRVDKVKLESIPFDWAAPLSKSVRAFPDVPGKPLMMIRLKAGSLGTKPIEGTVVSELLREGWSKPFSFSGKSYTLKTQVMKNADGRLLPGSIELQMAGGSGKSFVVLGRAPGHIFKEQKLMWAGDLNDDGLPDFYIRRVLVTGHVDHIISLSTGDERYSTAGITVDPDQPESLFTSGVGESEERETIFANSPSPFPEVVLPSADKVEKTNAAPVRFALSGAMPLKRYALVTEPMLKPFSTTAEPPTLGASAPVIGKSQPIAMSLPLNRVLKDMRFEFGGENYRMLVESVETYSGNDIGYQSSIAFGEYEGRGIALQVSVYHRGQRQVLLVTSLWMESGMLFSAGDLDGSGKLSFTIDYYPHYNNGMSYTWRRSEKPDQLFQRTVVYQSQGC